MADGGGRIVAGGRSEGKAGARRRRGGPFGLTDRSAVYLAGLVPAAWLAVSAAMGWLGVDPVRALEHVLGLWALRFLVLGLMVTPLRDLGWPRLIRYRRALGVLAFIYALLHLGVYLGLDQGLDPAAILADVLKRPYITVGLAALLLLIPLAATSTDAMVKRLGAAAWSRLHRLVYPAVALGVLHFVMVVKGWPPEPMVYAGIVAVLLGYRVWRKAMPKPGRAGRRRRAPSRPEAERSRAN
ncbi:MAG: protein-methionine-sulfoxide reductase heme-binding subunit MsrQ [Hyphomicrobiaceae bacterium]